MSPIEKIAIAIAEYAESQLPETNEFRIVLRSQRLAVARVALLALAECELPAELFDAATQAETDVRNSKKLERRFKFLLRSIAKGGET